VIRRAALAAAAALALTTPARAGRLHIAIVRAAPSAVITPEGKVMLHMPGAKPRPLEWKGPLPLKPREGGLRLADLKIPTETKLVPATGSGVKVGADRYEGVIILRLDPGQTVTVVEDAGVEAYLEGVLPHEMDPDWPLEALKAQAVVARTFTYANLGKFAKQGFDLTADTSSQVYKGRTRVNENVRAAVRQTRGEVLGWQGKLLRVFYHACCGGATTSPATAWNADAEVPKPLRGVRDPWCRASPHMSWRAYFAWPELTSALSEKRLLPGPLTSLKLGARDAAGHALTIIGKAGGRSVEVRANDLRRALGGTELKSLRLRALSVLKKGVEFDGAGSGHGVGLCQWGARLQAEKGRSYETILRFYFPGAELSEVDE
jgi:stage II sporulation protein D